MESDKQRDESWGEDVMDHKRRAEDREGEVRDGQTPRTPQRRVPSERERRNRGDALLRNREIDDDRPIFERRRRL
jgi:hypothetical protein